MAEKSARPQHLFIVRLWQEPSCAAPPGQWRGSVEHVPSGERSYFCALGDLSGFISQQIGGLAASAPTGPPEPAAPDPPKAVV